MRPTLVILLISIGLVSCSPASNDMTSFSDCSSLADAYVLHYDDMLHLAEKTANYVKKNQVKRSSSSTEKEDGQRWWHLDELYWTIRHLKSRPRDDLHAQVKTACSREADDTERVISARQDSDYPGSQLVELIRQLVSGLIT